MRLLVNREKSNPGIPRMLIPGHHGVKKRFAER
jgi:hypothetical protein